MKITAAAAAALLFAGGCGDASGGAHLRVGTSLSRLGFEDVYTETSYHTGLGVIETVTDHAVTLDGITFRDPDGVREVTGWLTDLRVPGAINIGGEQGDLRRRVPENTFVPLSGARVTPEDTDRWELLVTVVAGRIGLFEPDDVEVSWHDDHGHRGVLRVPFTVRLDVKHTGLHPDPGKE